MRRSLVAAILLAAASASAQDVLTIGSGTVSSGGTIQIPVHVRDVSGTILGSDAGAGRLIGGYALKVHFPSSRIASVSFVRAGVAATPTPLFESAYSGSDYVAAVASFSETNPMSFTLNGTAPGNQIGTLTFTLQAGIPAGTVIPLTIHPPSAMFSSQSGAHRETIAGGSLSLVHGSITVAGLAAPANLSATANGTTQVVVLWEMVGTPDHYEVWRSFNGAAFTPVATPSGASYTDTDVSAGITHLYRVRSVSASNEMSGFSNTDAATTIVFTEDPIVITSTIVKAVHFTELRAAVNAMRTAASLPPLGSDPTIAVGELVRASHVTALRTGLDQARAAIGQPALTYTDSVPTAIKAAHAQELRQGTK